MKVLPFRSDNCGVSWYRLVRPLEEMVRQKLIEIRSTATMWPVTFPVSATSEQDPKLQHVRDLYDDLCGWADILHTQRVPTMLRMSLYTSLPMIYGIPWIMDLDDDVFHVDELNPVHEAFREKEDDELFGKRAISSTDEAGPKELVVEEGGQLFAVTKRKEDLYNCTMQQIMQADALFVSTRPLAHLYANVRREIHKPDHIYVLPNSLTPRLWQAIEKPPDHEGEIWVGWAGSASHLGDVSIIAPLVDHLLKTYRNARFFWTRVPHPQLMGLARKWGQRCIHLEGWSGIEDWRQYYVSMNLDVALGPLEDNEFNRGKSNLKWLEAGINKQVFVGSRVVPYEDSIRNRKDGFLCSRPKQWMKTLDSVMSSKTLRQEVSGAAYERVMTDFNMEKNCHLWADAYKDVLEKLGDKCQDRMRRVRSELPASA